MSFNPTKLLNSAVANIICSLLFGGRYDYQDEHFQQLQKTIGKVFEFFQNTLPVSEYNLFEIVFCMSTSGKVEFNSHFTDTMNYILANLRLFSFVQFCLDLLWTVRSPTGIGSY